MAKDVVYIDIEDEITGVIDKVLSSKNKVVALVLPKRTTVFQSAVNVKLLKKSASEHKKSIVLVTSEESVINLAGASGIHVASTLNSKPTVPKPKKIEETETVINDSEYTETEAGAETSELKADESVSTSDDTIEMDNSDENEPTDNNPLTKAKTKLKKGFKIPDFSSFRLKFFLAIFLAVLLSVGSVFAFIIAPKASVTIATDSSPFEAVINFRANSAQKELDVAGGLVPSVKVSVKKTDTDKAAVTGKKDIGDRAKGKMTLTNCIDDKKAHTIPAGTSFSSGAYSFTTDEDLNLSVAIIGSSCLSDDLPSFGAQKTVNVTASASGQAYNLSARSYSSPISGISAYGSEMTGGSTKEVKAVSTEDVDLAKQRLTGKSKSVAIDELTAQLTAQGKKALADTLSESSPVYKITPAVGTEAEELTVSAEVTYELLGVNEEHLKTLLTDVITKKAEEINQKGIQDDGYSSIKFKLLDKKSNDDIGITMSTVSIIGPSIDTESIKTQIMGKKRGDIEDIIEAIPGVKNVKVEYSPFWVFEAPKSTKKITVTINQDK